MMDVNGNDSSPEWGYCQEDGCQNEAARLRQLAREQPADAVVFPGGIVILALLTA